MPISNQVKSVIASLAIGFVTTMAGAEVVVIVSAKNSTAALSADQVADIFLGNAAAFPSGGLAVPVDQAEGAPVRDEFYSKIGRKTAPQLKAHWSKIIFTGKGKPPKEAPDSAAIKKLVAENPNIIGYIDKGAADSSVKVVLTAR